MTEELILLGCYVVSSNEQFPTFRLMFNVKQSRSVVFLRLLGPWRWRRYHPSKRRELLAQRHGATF